jgi:hypothetical protein
MGEGVILVWMHVMVRLKGGLCTLWQRLSPPLVAAKLPSCIMARTQSLPKNEGLIHLPPPHHHPHGHVRPHRWSW